MSQAIAKPSCSFDLGTRLILLLAGVAFLAMMVPWYLKDAIADQGIPWRTMMAIAILAALLVWIVKSRSSPWAYGLVAGLLLGMCLVVNAGTALALFDYSASGDVAVALRILPVVIVLVPLAAVLGGVAGCVVGMLASLLARRAVRAAAKAPDREAHARRHRRGRLLGRFVAASLAAATLAALYFPVSRELSRRRAVLAIRAAGGHVSFVNRPRVEIASYFGPAAEYVSWLDAQDWNAQREGRFYSLESVAIVTLPSGAGDEQLAYVCDLPEVAMLHLGDSTITDAGLARVSAELTPAWLGLRHMSISDEALRGLVGIPSLQNLELIQTRLTDENLRHLAGAASLRLLNLSKTPITGEGLRYLAGLNSLAHLDLRGTRVTDDSLRHVGRMAALQWLDLGETPITSSGLKHLKSLQGLRGLDLSGTELKGGGLSQLSGLPALGRLNLEGARLDEAAFRELTELGKSPIAPGAPIGPPTILLNLDATNVTDDWLRHLTGTKGLGLFVTLYDTEVSEQGLRSLQKSMLHVVGGRRLKANGQ